MWLLQGLCTSKQSHSKSADKITFRVFVPSLPHVWSWELIFVNETKKLKNQSKYLFPYFSGAVFRLVWWGVSCGHCGDTI